MERVGQSANIVKVGLVKCNRGKNDFNIVWRFSLFFHEFLYSKAYIPFLYRSCGLKSGLYFG